MIPSKYDAWHTDLRDSLVLHEDFDRDNEMS